MRRLAAGALPVHALCSGRSAGAGTPVVLAGSGSAVAVCAPGRSDRLREAATRTDVLAGGAAVTCIRALESSGEFLVIGGRQVRIVRVSSADAAGAASGQQVADENPCVTVVPLSRSYDVGDWIWDGVELPQDCLVGVRDPAGRVLLLADAHNRVRVVHILCANDDSCVDWIARRPVILDPLCLFQGPESCILYSSRMAVRRAQDGSVSVLIAAGTVFSDVILWRIDNVAGICKRDWDSWSAAQCLAERKTLNERICTLVGLKGVVNAVDFSGENCMNICAVSDDRSACVWHNIDAWGETQTSRREVKPAYVCVDGHASRVWSALTLNGGKWLVTSGEDAVCCLWSTSTDLEPARDGAPLKAVLKAKFTGHTGKDVRCISTFQFDDNAPLHLVTGGGDAAVLLVSLDALIREDVGSNASSENSTARGSVQNCISEFASAFGSVRSAGFEQRLCMPPQSCVVATESGAILRAGRHSTSLSSADVLHRVTTKVTSISAIQDGQSSWIAYGDIAGNVTLLHQNQQDAVKVVLEDKCHPKSVLSILHMGIEMGILRIIAADHSGQAIIHDVRVGDDDAYDFYCRRLRLPQIRTKRAKVSCVLVLEELHVALFGDTDGSLYYVDFAGLEWNNHEEGSMTELSIRVKLSSVHGHEAVTYIGKADGDRLRFLCCGNDGSVSLIQLTVASSLDDACLRLVNKFPISFDGGKKKLASLRGLYMFPPNNTDDPAFLVWGFWSTSLVCLLQSLSGGVRHVLCIIDCGGARRSRDVCFDMHTRRLAFCWVSAAGNAICTAEVPLHNSSGKYFPVESLVDSIHANTTFGQHDVAISPAHSRQVNVAIPFASSQSFQVFATASDDSTIKLWRLSSELNLQMLQNLTGHKSNVRSIATITDKARRRTLLISGGGMSELRAWEAALECEEFSFAGACCLSENRMDQCRVMDLKMVHGELAAWLVVGLSDGRLLSLQLANSYATSHSKINFVVKFESTIHDCTILTLSVLKVQRSIGSAVVVIVSGGTDGRIRVTSHVDSSVLGSNIEQLLVLGEARPHTCGANTLQAFIRTKEGHRQLYILSGGDDQKLCVSSAELEEGQNGDLVMQKLRVQCSVYAHNAAITGLFCWSDFVATTAADQRLNIWKFKPSRSADGILTWVDGLLHDVPDSSSVCIIDHSVAVVTGAGFACFDVSSALHAKEGCISNVRKVESKKAYH